MMINKYPILKTNPHNHEIVWTKFYYDWTNQKGRYDFFENYWTPYSAKTVTNYTILFINTTIYYIYPLENSCYIRATDIGLISPYWLQSTIFEGLTYLRGVWSQRWRFKWNPSLLYFNRATPDLTPLRSTNQINDLGATDYYDFILGAQNQSLFEIPSICPKVNETEISVDIQEAKKWSVFDSNWPGWEHYKIKPQI
eukprot:TRINITY_DN1201_c4_g1_i1.p1 TRINITY_DN1201_c4_g1~~TRINITY_DN1201_c4_g1_i1.p1  ORF type:complete len:197 (-),score=70.99 TRINITY_DN1201_c4_g1_i1:96-686(-)